MTLASTQARSTRAPHRVTELVTKLMYLRRLLSLEELTHLVTRTGLTRDDVGAFVQTREAGYAHRELFRSPYVELGCIGWRRGHHTPVHDHDDSVCCVLVLAGILTNTAYRPVGSVRAAPVETHQLRSGEVLALRRGAIHHMANEHDAELVTLHVYSPPLTPMPNRIRLEFAPDDLRSA